MDVVSSKHRYKTGEIFSNKLQIMHARLDLTSFALVLHKATKLQAVGTIETSQTLVGRFNEKSTLKKEWGEKQRMARDANGPLGIYRKRSCVGEYFIFSLLRTDRFCQNEVAGHCLKYAEILIIGTVVWLPFCSDKICLVSRFKKI